MTDGLALLRDGWSYPGESAGACCLGLEWFSVLANHRQLHACIMTNLDTSRTFQMTAELEMAIAAEEEKQRQALELQAHAVAGNSAAQAAREKLASGRLSGLTDPCSQHFRVEGSLLM